MTMRYYIALFIVLGMLNGFAQEKTKATQDLQLKETLYSKYRKEVLAFSKKDYDALFFEFMQKQNDGKINLTKEQYYTYTIKIAIYAEKLGLLYKDQKSEAQKTKQEWFARNYQDYLQK